MKLTTRQIDKLFNEFDFKRVCDVMLFLNWSWLRIGRVPDIYELKSRLRDLIDECKDDASLSAGGLKVTKKGDSIEILFVLESHWEDYDDIRGD